MVLSKTMCYPEAFRKRTRPILINSWEAYYMKINEHRLYQLAKKAKRLGIEMLVIDDGWFKGRNKDNSSLGDWVYDKRKFRRGLGSFAKRINQLGLKLGIWVEPEMISVNSDLYRKHPEYAVDIPNQKHSEGRNQRLLDLCNPEVVDYVIKAISDLLGSADISYVKWDYNRNISDAYSKYLKTSDGFYHRYILGLYKIMDALTKSFPDILFEGCASGGNRFDLGILSYFPEIWASDNTDAICRLKIQKNLSYGYPPCTYSNHVSSVPNHQTLRSLPLFTRFAVACFGIFGYELNLNELTGNEKKDIRRQVTIYKEYRDVFQFGAFHLLEDNDEYCSFEAIALDRTRAVIMLIRKEISPHQPFKLLKGKGFKDDGRYQIANLPLKYEIERFGDLVNYVSPVHISRFNPLRKLRVMNSEKMEMLVDGKALNEAGIKLDQSFCGCGYNANTRLMGQYDAMLYFINEIKGEVQ